MTPPVPPNDGEAEAAAIGAMLSDDAAAKIGFGMIVADDFYCPKNRQAFETLFVHWLTHRTLDRLTFTPEFRVTTDEYASPYHQAFDIERYAGTLRKFRLDREALKKAAELTEAAYTHRGAEILGEDETPYDSTGLEKVEEEFRLEIEGQRYAVEVPKFPRLSCTKALLPGSITVFCGSPGASKSLFLLECLWRWFMCDIRASVLMLEKGVTFHMRRALAQICDEARLTDDKFVKAYKSEVRVLLDGAREKMERIEAAKIIQAPRSQDDLTVDYLLQWLEQQAESGDRVSIMDPVTIMDSSSRPWDDHKKFVREAGRIVTKYQMSLICVTHPKSSIGGGGSAPALENVSGGRAWREFSDTVIWLEAHEATESTVARMDGEREDLIHNRSLHLLKTRLGWGGGQRIAVDFDTKTLCHFERGQIVEKK